MEGSNNLINLDIDTNIIDISEKITKIKINEKEENEVKEETLTQMIDNCIKDSTLQEFVHLLADEIVSDQSCTKSLSVGGRVSKNLENELNQLQIKILEKIKLKIGNFININKFWTVDSGMKESEKFTELEVLNHSGEKIKILHKLGTILVINFWSAWSGLATYLNYKIELVKKIENNELENLNLENIKFISISGEDDFSIWKELSCDQELNTNVPQFYNKNIYDIVGIKLIPSVMIVDKTGEIKYFDILKQINLEESLKNLANENDKIVKNNIDFDFQEKNPNEWWLDMDEESKLDIVRNINLSLRELGSYSSQFAVITKFKHLPNNILSNTIPVFMGTMFEAEFEILQNFAVDLQMSMNFNNFLFECKVMG